ncbi:hypothetical protein Purlil1_7725 [Purpureocillium lilacinum]|uniref:Major facilitator superfamily (MFS) profile domain-containing protein n=1 Tax=Purpureocillium lilacinum TaxID=33203 RepID=A0ABR0BVG0_PURLI|nr:hypothetical protein Purlil1_7725 [Purpureocillium lilacinum]
MSPPKDLLASERDQQPAVTKRISTSTAPIPLPPPYSVFTRRQHVLVLCLASYAASFSPLSSFIFFPAIDDLSQALQVPVGRINLTITSYMIVAGLAPALLGDLADKIGRRPVYLFMMSVYCVANVGLALQNNWTALFLLRMLQSCGSAATIAVGYGVVSDIAPPSKRGTFVSGLVLGVEANLGEQRPNITTAVGPILGGALASYLGWRWIFWFLAISSGACLLLIALLLPETARSIVGDGSGKVSGFRRTVLSHWQLLTLRQGHRRPGSASGEAAVAIGNDTGRRLKLPNPLASLKLLWAKDSALITLIFGIFYMNLSSLQASTSTLFLTVYDISGIQLGLVYLPSGIGSCIGAYCAGQLELRLEMLQRPQPDPVALSFVSCSLLDHDYRVIARKNEIEINIPGSDDLDHFPIERARFRSIWHVISAGAVSLVGYGWSLQLKANMAVPLVLHFVIGLSTAVVFNICGTLLVDIHPRSPSTAQAANSIVRAFLAGGGTALVEVFIDSMGVGWTFTIFGGLGMIALALAWLEWVYGEKWRKNMRDRGVER